MAFALKPCGVPALQTRRASSVRPSSVIRTTRSVVVRAEAKSFESNWLRADPLVLGAGFLGWTLPSSIPVGALDNNSLFGLFQASIGQELSHFPVGPALGDKFWLYLLTWHVGLFVVLLLGQVGVNGRKQGYWGK